MKKLIISNIFFKESTWKVVLFLLAFIILALVISNYLPFYYKEGLLSNTYIINIKKALAVYDTEVEKICKENVETISKLKLSQADSVTFSPILGDKDLTHSAKIDKITALKSTNDDVKKTLVDINGKKYVALLTLLNTLNKETYTDDETFTALLKQQTASAINVVSGDNSVYSQLNDYLKTIENVPK